MWSKANAGRLRMKLSVVIPIFNETATIRNLVKLVMDADAKHFGK